MVKRGMVNLVSFSFQEVKTLLGSEDLLTWNLDVFCNKVVLCS
jgi:hypothetical protein